MSESRIMIPARYDRIKEVCTFVVDAAEQAGLDETAIFHCQIAVDEACTNVIEHGYAGEDRGHIEVFCHVSPGQLKIELLDQAPPFDVTQVPDPELSKPLEEATIGGLGIYFMRKMMDEVKYEHTDRTNRLTLVKRSSA